MSDKFFFNGKPMKKPKHVSESFSTKRAKRLGTEESPLSLTVTSQERFEAVTALVTEHNLVATVVVDENADENITELDILINKPKTIVLEKTPNRNDPCSCGSGKKYKKCCG